MTRIVIKKLVWDKSNTTHIQKHSVTILEVEQAGSQLIYHRRTRENRYLAIGRSSKRLITLVLKRQSTGTYYVVTARDASKKERKVVYEKEDK